MTSHLRKLVRLVPIVLAVAFLLGESRPALAQVGCFERLADCYQRAAARDSWGRMWLAGLDCEVNLLACLEHAIAK